MRVIAEVLELALPRACGGCSRPGSRWCPACARRLAPGGAVAWAPEPRPDGCPPVWVALPYGGCVQRTVVAWKDAERPDLTQVLAPVLAAVLARALSTLPPGRAPLVVPVPSRARATRQRGWSPAHTLAVRAAADTGAGLRVAPALRVARAVRDQAELGAQGRAVNLQGAFVVPARWLGVLVDRPVVLVDDVVTTGSSLSEAARALRAAGGGPVVAVTVAATLRRRAGLPPVWGQD